MVLTQYVLQGHHSSKPHLKCAVVMRRVQLLFSRWLDQQSKSGALVASPNYTDILDDMQMQTFLEPTIPSGYLPRNSDTNINNNRNRGGQGNEESANGGTTGGTGGGTTGGTSGTGGGTGNGTPGRFERNPSHDPETFQAYANIQGVSMRNLMNWARQNNHLPPATEEGNLSICPAWYIRGGCNTNCGRSASHGRTLTQTEKTRMLEWCEIVFPGYQASQGC